MKDILFILLIPLMFLFGYWIATYDYKNQEMSFADKVDYCQLLCAKEGASFGYFDSDRPICLCKNKCKK